MAANPPGLRQRRARRYDPFTESWTEVVITEPEPEPEPEPELEPELLLEEVDLGVCTPDATGAAPPPAPAALASAGSEHVPPAPAPQHRHVPAAAAAPPPNQSVGGGCLALVALAGALVYLAGAGGKLGEALRRASASHDSAAVCALDLAESSYWAQPREASTEEAVALGRDCVDDPSKLLLGSDCAAYSLYPGCAMDLHEIYDGALYGPAFKGQAVRDVCPRSCGLCT